MKKAIIISFTFLLCSSNFVMAETSAVKCFEMGFSAASKAYKAGDKSAFTPVYGMSPKMMKASPCCKIGTEPGCLGYNGAFQYVQQYGTDKNTIEYQERSNLFRMMDSGMFGY